MFYKQIGRIVKRNHKKQQLPMGNTKRLVKPWKEPVHFHPFVNEVLFSCFMQWGCEGTLKWYTDTMMDGYCQI